MKSSLQIECFEILREKIRIAWKNKTELKRLDNVIVRHYENGTISALHLRKLDQMIMTRICKL